MTTNVIDTDASSLPFFRVRLWGPFRVEKRVGEIYEVVKTAEWGGSNHPRVLLKALLCCPARCGRREALLDLLWPEMDSEQATANLNTATTKLRQLLRPAKRQESLLVTEHDATIYQLPDQTMLWVDGDAVQHVMERVEHLGRTAREALPLLEEAITLSSRGTFLEGEEGIWATKKRATRERERYRGRIWLAEGYEQQGMTGQAETVLTTLLEDDPFDEDVLSRLMALLQSQGMTHQALLLYQRTRNLFLQEQMELTEATKTFATQLQEKRVSVGNNKGMIGISLSPALPDHEQPDRTPIFGQQAHISVSAQNDYTFHMADGLGENLSAIWNAQQPLSPTETLERLSRALAKPMQLDDRSLLALEEVVRDCWRFRPDILGTITPHLLQVVLGHLRQITVFLSGSLLASTRMRLCALTSELTQIAGWTLYEMRAFSQAQAYYRMAIVAAREAEHSTLEAIALARMSRTFKYCAQEESILPSLQQARHLLNNQQKSPVYSWLWAEEALAYAREKRAYESLKALEHVTEIFQPENQEDDPYWVGFEANVQAGFFGSCYVALQQPEPAEVWYREALAQLYGTSRINPNHRRSLLSINLATIMVEREALEEACQLAREALHMLSQSKSPLVLQHLVKFRRKLEPWKSQAAVETFEAAFLRIQASFLKSEATTL